MSANATERASLAFQKRFHGEPPLVVRAPGRVNLIGEHTDYNGGFVLPVAIDLYTVLAVRPVLGRRVTLFSVDLGQEAGFEISASPRESMPQWIRYVAGVNSLMMDSGIPISGWEGVVATDLPVGAGLSSSAALEVSVARAGYEMAGAAWNPLSAAQMCQAAENLWAGVACGVMDQVVSACAREGNAVLLDCRSLDLNHAPLPVDCSVVVLDTAKRRRLSESAYNERKSECSLAAAHWGVSSLREVDSGMFDREGGGLPDAVLRRARHVISENARTQEAFGALAGRRVGDLRSLMAQSHASLRDDYEVSCPELDAIVEAASRHPDCLGVRMTGAGFGGCAVALVREERAGDFGHFVRREYLQATGLSAGVYACRPAAGAQVIG